MRISNGISELRIECETGTRYQSKVRGDTLIIEVFKRRHNHQYQATGEAVNVGPRQAEDDH